ncbi:hypothetical protein EMCRGX_G007860 [Ephydatia muelleri]
MQRKLKAVSQHRHFNSRMELYKWEAHASDDECKVCDHFRAQHHGGRPHKAKTPLVELLLKHIQHLAPNKKNIIKGMPLAAIQPISVLDNLKCSLCCDILHRPIQLPCQTVVCADCLAHYLVKNGCLQCPCKGCCTKLTAESLKSAPSIYVNLLEDVALHCSSTMLTSGQDSPPALVAQASISCSPPINCEQGQDQDSPARIIHRMLSSSPEPDVITVPTGGRPITLVHVTNSKRPISKASSKTLRRYRKQVQKVRHVLTSDDPTILLREEIRSLSKNEKNSLLKDAGITLDISPEQGLAIKADLTLPWNKIRMIRRWLKGSGICLASERKQRQLAATLVGDNLDAEIAPFTFLTASKNEEVRGAPHAFIPRLQDSVFDLLEDNARCNNLTWHNGRIPETEIWVKVGGDKGGSSFKMNFQIVNTPTPNSVQNTCVFSVFEAGDSTTNLHMALDRYKPQIESLQGMKWREYSMRIFICGDYEFLSKLYGLSGANGRHPCPYCTINQDEMQLSMSMRAGCSQSRSLQSFHDNHQRFLDSGGNAKKVKEFYNCISKSFFDVPLSQVCLPGLHISQGIFLKIFNLLENACHDLDVKMALIHSGHSTLSPSYTNHVLNLQELNRAKVELDTVVQYLTMLVEHQTYLTVAIGQSNSILANFEEHIDECRKEIKAAEKKVQVLKKKVEEGFSSKEGPFVKALDIALQSFGVRRQNYHGGAFVGNHVHKTLEEAEMVAGTFKQTFSLFAKCHFIYNQNYVSEAGCNDLEHAIATFMAHFRATFPGENIPIKMHMLEDHAVDRIRSNQHIGFGLMGEQGAESIHARFNRLYQTYSTVSSTSHPVEKLKYIMKEHLLSISPTLITAKPPPSKRAKKSQ